MDVTNTDNEKRGLIARILGGQPTVLQKIVFWLMLLPLLIWPVFSFVSVLFFDAPIQSTVDEVSRYGMVLTIWLYPLYLLPLMRLCFWASKRLRASWLFCFCPLIPVAVFFLFVEIDSSEYAARKPDGYDSSTFERINESYAKDVNHVYYCNEILEKADPASFRVLNDNYAVDAQHVWHRGNVIENADPATFIAPDDSGSLNFSLALTHDAHDYYCGTKPLHVADMASFTRKGSSWAIDSLNVYFIGADAKIGEDVVPIGDYHTFHMLNDSYAADVKQVYYKSEIVEGADPKSFAPLNGEWEYGQDNNRVYYHACGTSIRNLDALKHKNMEKGLWDAFHTDGTIVYNPKLLPMPAGCDFSTIHRVERYRDWYADKSRVYYENRLLPGANPQTFRIFQSHYVSKDYVLNNKKDASYSCDGDHVYFRDSLMSGVDVSSFFCGYDFVDSCSFAFDKNRYYQGSPNPRLEKLRQGKCQVDSE